MSIDDSDDFPKSLNVIDFIDKISSEFDLSKLKEYNLDITHISDKKEQTTIIEVKLIDINGQVKKVNEEVIYYNTINYKGYSISEEVKTIKIILDRQVKINKLI